MTVQPTLEYRTAGSDGEWTRMDPARREQWQWHDSPDWLASEALWMLGEGCEVRLVSTGLPAGEMFGDYTSGNGGSGCLSLNPPGDDPPVPAGSTHCGEPAANAGKPNPRTS